MARRKIHQIVLRKQVYCYKDRCLQPLRLCKLNENKLHCKKCKRIYTIKEVEEYYKHPILKRKIYKGVYRENWNV